VHQLTGRFQVHISGRLSSHWQVASQSSLEELEESQLSTTESQPNEYNLKKKVEDTM